MHSTWPTECERLNKRFPALEHCLSPLTEAARTICKSLDADGLLMTCGNGGSAADADHIVGELLKSFCCPRPLPAPLQTDLRKQHGKEGDYLANHLEQGLRAIALTGHPALATAMANDVAGDLAFAQQLLALGRPNDVLIGISTSGNSGSVCHAMRLARTIGITTIGFTGAGCGTLVRLSDITIEAPATSTAEIQEYHLPLYHALCRMIEHHFFTPQP